MNQSVVNPIDGPAALYNPPLLEEVLKTLTADPSIDAVILHISTAFNLITTPEVRAMFKSRIAAFNKQYPGKPVVVAVDGLERSAGEVERIVRELRDADITTYSSLRAACRALKHLADYYSFRAS